MKPRRTTPRPAPRARAGFQTWPVLVVLALAGATAWYGFGPGHWFSGETQAVIEGSQVQRGPLKISVVERGNLKAADSVSMKSEIEGQTTILTLLPEGTVVKEGDLVCELDATSQIDKRFQQEISVRNSEASFVKSKQNYEIQKSQNDSDIKNAEQALFFADTDLRKFREGEKKATEDEADEKIKLSEEEFTRAQEKVGWSEKLASKGFLTTTELEADKLSLSRAQIQLEQAKRDKDLLIRFQLPRDEAELSAQLDESKRELERVKLQAAARIVDYEADLKTKEAQLALEREKLQKLVNQIAKAKMYAPRAGMVVYAQEEGGRYGNSQPIKEGTSVRERQEIVTIPSAAGMIAQVSLHESVLKMVQIGQACEIKADALAGKEFHGRVRFVAMMADQNSWFANPNTRLYRTEVAIDDPHPEMRPGMSCSIEILVDQIADTLFVPVQCVFRNGTDNVVFVRDSGAIAMRTVEVGKYNDRWVQILSGLTEGQTVLMSAPPGFSPEPVKDKPGEPGATPPAPGAQPAGAGQGPGAGAPVADGAAGAQHGANPSERGGERRDGERGDQRSRDGGERGDRGSDGGDDFRSRMSNMSEEERAKMAEQWRSRMANMSEEERAKMMEEFRNRRGGGGSPGGGGNGSGSGGGVAPGGGQASESNAAPAKSGDGK